MIWKETGVQKGSFMCFFNPSQLYREVFLNMVSCGYFLVDHSYRIKKTGGRAPLFIYIIAGSLRVDYEGKEYTAGKNSIVLLNGYRPHLYACENACEFLFFHFDGMNAPQMVDRLIDENGGPLFQKQNAQEIYRSINQPILRLCHQEQATEAMLSSLVYSALCMLSETGLDAGVLIPSHVSVQPDSISYKIIEYVDRHIEENFTVQQLADQVNLSRHYFIRLFKKETGYTPLEYVSAAKINYAKMMLRTTALSVTEIADYLGYSSPASFINAFRARRGVSPNRYRYEKQK